MLSERKGIVGLLAAGTAICLLVDLALWLRLHSATPPASSHQSLVFWMLGFTFVFWFAAMWVVKDFIEVAREGESWLERTRGMNGATDSRSAKCRCRRART